MFLLRYVKRGFTIPPHAQDNHFPGQLAPSRGSLGGPSAFRVEGEIMLMTSEEFWHLIHRYDAAIFPVQFVFSAAAIVLLVFIARRPSPRGSGLKF